MCIPPQVSAGPDRNREINEAILAAVWNEQSPLRGPMWDCAGEPVAVVYRGRWTAGSGPDFEGAMLALGEGGGRLVTGSVEVHLRCGDCPPCWAWLDSGKTLQGCTSQHRLPGLPYSILIMA